MGIKLNARQYITYADNKNSDVGNNRGGNIDNLIQNQNRKQYNGYLSDTAQRKIKNYTHNLHAISSTTWGKKKKGFVYKSMKIKTLGFITLTLPSQQQHTDNEIKRHCLQPFLAELKRVYNMRHYIWIAEAQRGGNIHFHIITPTYIEKSELRAIWKHHINTLGYIDRCKYTDPPCTEIEGARSVKHAARYLAKYITKAETDKRKIEGRLWGIDTETEKLMSIDITQDEADEIYRSINKATTLLIESEYFNVYMLDIFSCPILHKYLVTRWLRLLSKSD